MDTRERTPSLPGFKTDLDGRQSSESGGVRAARVGLLNEFVSEALKILKQGERHLPDAVERLSPSIKKQLGDLMQRSLAEWRKAAKGVNNVG